MKRFIVPLLTALVVVTMILAGCAPEASPPVEEEFVVGWSPVGYPMNVGRLNMDEGIKKGVEEAGGRLIYCPSAAGSESIGDPSTQAACVDMFIVEGVDAIILDPCDTTAIIPSIKKANEADIPVFLGIFPVMAGSGVDVVLSTGLEYRKGSHLAAQTIIDGLTEKYGEPRGLVLELLGVMTTGIAQERSGYFHEVIDEYPEIEVVMKEGYDDMAKCGVTVEDWFSAHPETDAIYMYSTAVYTPPTLEVLNKIGKWQKIGHPDHVIIAGHDALAPELYCIKSGYVDMTYGNGLALAHRALSTVAMQYLETGVRPKVGDSYETGISGFETAEVVEAPDITGLLLQISGFAVTQENCDHPSLFGNFLEDEPNGMTEPDTMDWWD